MGCTSTASILTVTFNSTKKTPKQKFSDYSALRAWISNEFLELREKAYKLQVYQKPSIKIKNAFDYYSLLKKYSGELNLEAIIEKSKRYKPEIFGKITPSIFKIRKGKDDVEAVGFFLSPRLCLIGIKYMELAIIRRETIGAGAQATNENETIAKYEVMDGAPVRGENIPIRMFLSAFELTPTYYNVNNKFSIRHFLNLVLVDEEDRRYFKQQEIILWRKEL